MRTTENKRRICAGISKALAMSLAMGFAIGAQAQQKSPEELKELAYSEDLNPFLRDAKAGLVARTSYFDRRSAGAEQGASAFRQQAMGLGGWFYGNSGEIGNTFSVGGTYNFVIPLYGPSDTPYNYILRDPNQDPVSVLGEAYAKLRFGNNALVLGRQSINQAWYLPDIVRFYNKLDQSMIGRRDVRAMQPINYEAATAQGRLLDDTLRYYGGYVWNARQINDNHFRNPFQAAFQTTCWPQNPPTTTGACGPGNGDKSGDSNGVAYVGMQFKPSNNMMIEGSYYNFQNMMNNVYLDFDYVFRLENKNYVRVGTQYMYQSGSGDNLVVNGNGTPGKDFNTNYVGLYGELRLIQQVVPYAMLGWTGKGQEIRSPYSIGPSYLVQRIGENSKAGEDTWIIGSIFDFGSFGAQGLTFDINYGERSNRLDNNGNPIQNWNELATDLVYVYPGEGFLKNLRTRLRYAKVKEFGYPLVGDKFTDDLRFDMALTIPFK